MWSDFSLNDPARGLRNREKRTKRESPYDHYIEQEVLFLRSLEKSERVYLAGTVTETPNLSDEIDWRIRTGWDELQTLQAGTVRPPEGKSAASEGPDGEVRGSRGSLIYTDARHGPP